MASTVQTLAVAGLAATLSGCQQKSEVPKKPEMLRVFMVNEYRQGEDGNSLYDRSETSPNGAVHYFGGRSWNHDGYKVQINDSAVQLPDGRQKIRHVSLLEKRTGLHFDATDYGMEGNYDQLKVPSESLFWVKGFPADERTATLLETVKREAAKLDYASATIVRQLEQ